jgi:pimeloyl-ACP methyl ester carboxylesterase
MLVDTCNSDLNSQEAVINRVENLLVNQVDTLIVYAHGAFASKKSWFYVQKQVNKSIRTKIVTAEYYFEYDLQEDDAFTITDNLTTAVRKLIKEKNPKRILFVGHSFGGVLVVATSRRLEAELRDKVEMRVVTMSAPFGGARIASLVTMFTPSSTFFNNISHNSQFMWQFKTKPLICMTHSFITMKGRVKWIAGENDGVVTVDSQLQFKNDPFNTFDIVDSNHFEILLSDNIATRIAREALPKTVKELKEVNK